VPLVVLLAGSPRPGTGIAERALVIGAPMVNAFPIMALATGLVLALGLFRRLTQRLRLAEPPARKRRPVSSRRGPGADEAHAAARTSRSPRLS